MVYFSILRFSFSSYWFLTFRRAKLDVIRNLEVDLEEIATQVGTYPLSVVCPVEDVSDVDPVVPDDSASQVGHETVQPKPNRRLALMPKPNKTAWNQILRSLEMICRWQVSSLQTLT